MALARLSSTKRWWLHPGVIFLALQLVWLSLTVLWVTWFIDELHLISALAAKLDTPIEAQHRYSLITLVVGCVLLGVLFIGTFFLFFYGEKQRKLNTQQKQFLSSVTHELRSPVASLQLCLETLQSRQLDTSTMQTLLAMGLKDMERLSRNVDHILISARFDKGIEAFAEETEWIDITPFMEMLLQTFPQEPVCGSGGKRWELVIHDHIRMQGAKLPLTLIFSNLIDNALKYSQPHQKIVIEVEKDKDQAHVTVSDQGVGLERSEYKKIFRMFYRSSVATKQAIKGTGLGLFIVATMTRLLKGQIWVESQGLGKGCDFHVSLPLQAKKKFWCFRGASLG